MIYLENAPNLQQVVAVPTASPLYGAAAFSLFSTVDRREVYQAAVISSGKRLTVSVAVTLPEGLSDGEYEYRIHADGVTLESGLAVIGAAPAEKQYKETFEYKQFTNNGE